MLLDLGYAALALLAWFAVAFVLGTIIGRCIHTDPPEVGGDDDISMTSELRRAS